MDGANHEIPTLPAPNLPSQPRSGQESQPSAENKPSSGIERGVSRPERSGNLQSGMPAATSDPSATPVVVQPQQSQAAQPTPAMPATSSPSVADDVDVIEKEWIDKAKSVVNATRDDPHAQEKEVSKLQADYLFKRYGKQIKTTE